MTSADIDRLIRELARNSEIVALVHLLEKSDRCVAEMGGWDYENTPKCNDFAIVGVRRSGCPEWRLCQSHLDAVIANEADPKVIELWRKNWGKEPDPYVQRDLPRAKEVRRLLALLKREAT